MELFWGVAVIISALVVNVKVITSSQSGHAAVGHLLHGNINVLPSPLPRMCLDI